MLPTPSPPAGHHYVRQDLTGGQYVSTGWFKDGTVGRNGSGRTVANVVGVGTLMFDLDVVSVLSAARASQGAVLEEKVASRKAYMYATDPYLIDSYKGWIRDEMLPTMAVAAGCPPTCVVDTGWGYHLHYRVAADMAGDTKGLSKIAKLLITEANRLCMERGLSMAKVPLKDLRPWDATHDVGARLCRIPGTLNTKAPGNSKRCEIVEGGDPRSIIDRARCGDIQGRLAPSMFQVPSRTRKTRAKNKNVDFREKVMPDGRSWQGIVDNLGPGECARVVCPFGGNSVGSGWFTKETDGKRSRYNSSITNTTLWNDYSGEKQRNGRAELVKTDKGVIRNTLSNLRMFLEQDGRFNLWYDMFTERVVNNDKPIDDDILMWTRLWMEQDYGWFWGIADQKLWQMVELVAKLESRNPLADYLHGIQWDGQPRTDRLLIQACGVHESKLHRAYAKKFLVSMVARALSPGCKVDTSLVLTGPQGWGKSTFFRMLVDIDGLPGLFCDTRFNINDKDSYMQLYSSLIYEDAEMVGQSRASNEARKSFLSSEVDRFRPPYGRTVRSYKRHNVIVSTTNSTQFLTDHSGSRRYWVVSVGDAKRSKLDRKWIRTNRTQLLAEAVHLFKAGEQWWLSPNEERARSLQNALYQYKDWFAQCAEDVYNTNSGGVTAGFQIKDFAVAIPHMGKTPANPQRDGKRLRIALLGAGFEYAHTNRHQRTYYRRDIQSDENDNGLHILDDKPVNADSPVKLVARKK